MAIFGLMTQKRAQAMIVDALKQAAEKYPQWLLATAAGEQYSMPDMSIYQNQADLYRRLSWVLAAVMHVAHEAALTEFGIYKVSGEDLDDIPNHPFEQLLYHPNPLDSRQEFLYGTVAQKKLTGNAYWWLNKTSEKAPPDELWLLPSHMVQPVPDDKMYLKGYLYRPGNGAEILLEPWEVVQFRSYNPFSRFLGLSAIEALAIVAGGDLGMQTWQTKFFGQNNARLPGMLLFASMIADDQWDKIKQDTREAAKNREMLMLRGTGSDEVRWLQNAVSQKEMEFIGSRVANKEEIWTVLAPGLASMLAINATEANAQAGRATFKERAVYPELVTMQEKITAQILPDYGDNLRGQFEDIRWTDRMLELQELQAYSQTHTVEEIRQKYYNDQPIGDERDQLFVVQITAESGQPEPEPEETETTTPLFPPAVVEESGQGEMEEEEKPEEEDEESEATKAMLDELDKWKRKAVKKIGKDVDFYSEAIPEDVMAEIHAGLPACKTRDDIKALFAKVNVTATPQVAYHDDGWVVLDAIRAEVEAIKASKALKQEPMNLTIHNYPGETPVVNVAATKQEAPVVNINVEPTPVTVQNDVNVNVPEQQPPDVKITNEVKVDVPEQQPPTVEVKVPQGRRTLKVHRGADGRIDEVTG